MTITDSALRQASVAESPVMLPPATGAYHATSQRESIPGDQTPGLPSLQRADVAGPRR